MFGICDADDIAVQNERKLRRKGNVLRSRHTRASRDRIRCASRLARPASFGKHHATLVGRAAKRASQFEGLVALRSGRHLTRELQRIRSSLVPIQSVTIG